MEVGLKYVFSSDLIVRCRYANGHPIPVEVVDMVDVLEKLKSCLKIQGASRSRAVSDPSLKRKPFHTLREHILHPSCSATNPKSTKHSSLKSVYYDQTDSVILQMSPAMQSRRLKKHTIAAEEVLDDSETEDEKVLDNSKHLNDPTEKDKPLDFVYISTFDRLDKAEHFLRKLKSTKITFSIEIDVGVENQISISYQELLNFDCEYMVLKCSKNECLVFIKPF